MDMVDGTNSMAEGTYGFTDVPLGFGLALAMNESAAGAYEALSELEKEHLLMRCRDAASEEEMQEIVASLVTDRDITGVLEEQRDALS